MRNTRPVGHSLEAVAGSTVRKTVMAIAAFGAVRLSVHHVAPTAEIEEFREFSTFSSKSLVE